MLRRHIYKGWQGKDGYFRTYLPDEKKGRKLVKRCSLETLEKAIIEYYQEEERKAQVTFQKMYWRWRGVQDILVCDNTVIRYGTDYQRFFEGEEFLDIAMEKLTEEHIKVFMCKTIKDKNLNKKAAKTLFGYISNVVKSARIMCEWVFADSEGRIHAPVISSCTKNKCRQVGITEKGIHAYRKTVNSKMRCNGVASVVAASLLGHSQQVNEEYYTFDVATIQDKLKIVSQINRQICHCG